MDTHIAEAPVKKIPRLGVQGTFSIKGPRFVGDEGVDMAEEREYNPPEGGLSEREIRSREAWMQVLEVLEDLQVHHFNVARYLTKRELYMFLRTIWNVARNEVVRDEPT